MSDVETHVPPLWLCIGMYWYWFSIPGAALKLES